MTDQLRDTEEDISAERLRKRQERRAERKRRGNASLQRALASQMPGQKPRRSAARAPNLIGPIAQRIGRIGGRMIFKQLIKILLGSVLRR